MKADDVMLLIRAELERATELHGPMHGPHEALGVIREEYLELEREIFHGDDAMNALEEAVQLAAMAARFCVDCITTPGEEVEP